MTYMSRVTNILFFFKGRHMKKCNYAIGKILIKHSPPGDEIRKHSDKNSSRGKKGGKGVIVPDHPSPFSFQIEVLV